MASLLYLQGVESGPQATKALALREAGFTVHAPQLDTGAAVRLVASGVADAAAWQRALAGPTAQAAEALTASPDVIVGSSFGAAVLLQLLHEGVVRGVPVVMLAGAGVRLTSHRTLPSGVPAVLVHGRQDEVVPIADSRLLAESSRSAVLVEVHDDHRLTRTTASGLLVDVVRLAWSAARLRSE
jgi:alpha/beta superfamily hydrolase